MFRHKPMIQDALTPEQLFSEDDLIVIKAALDRHYARERYGKGKQVNQAERARAGKLLRKGRFHGYYAPGVDSDGSIRWSCLCVPAHKRMVKDETRISRCPDCRKEFYSIKYEGQGLWPEQCWNCEERAKQNEIKKAKARPVVHDIPNLRGPVQKLQQGG